MIIFPAIDIKDGKVVRLVQGNFDQATEYSGDPVIVAKRWADKGAQWLHLVDLDGALTGEFQNIKTILSIAEKVDIPVQMGGGVREKSDIELLINGGVKRVIIGTKGLEDKGFLKDVIGKWKDKIAVSLDCSEGFIAQHGWTTTSEVKAEDFVKELEALGLSCLIYTDITRDGTLSGPNIEGLKSLLDKTAIPVIASGGVASLDDIKKLLAIKSKNLLGVITGKALYEGKFDLKDALALCSQSG